jgi:hypothetical protein
MDSIQQLLQRDIIQGQLAKSLEVAERLYDLLTEKADIVILREVTLPAGSPDTDIDSYDFTNTKFEGNYVNIQIIGKVTNATMRIIYEWDGIEVNPFSITTQDLLSDSIIVLRGLKVRVRLTGISASVNATAKVVVAVKKVMPVSFRHG